MAGWACLLGVRPEHFRFGGRDDLEITIDVVQRTGSRSCASFELAGTRALAEFDAHRIAPPRGSSVPLIAMNRTVLFDPTTELAIPYGASDDGEKDA